jgi:hypothetical protein
LVTFEIQAHSIVSKFHPNMSNPPMVFNQQDEAYMYSHGPLPLNRQVHTWPGIPTPLERPRAKQASSVTWTVPEAKTKLRARRALLPAMVPTTTHTHSQEAIRKHAKSIVPPVYTPAHHDAASNKLLTLARTYPPRAVLFEPPPARGPLSEGNIQAIETMHQEEGNQVRRMYEQAQRVYARDQQALFGMVLDEQ